MIRHLTKSNLRLDKLKNNYFSIRYLISTKYLIINTLYQLFDNWYHKLTPSNSIWREPSRVADNFRHVKWGYCCVMKYCFMQTHELPIKIGYSRLAVIYSEDCDLCYIPKTYAFSNTT
jgi:hypothetical protein